MNILFLAKNMTNSADDGNIQNHIQNHNIIIKM